MNKPALHNRVAIVTGGTRGIGRAVVHALVQAGACCLFTYVTNQNAAEALAAEMRSAGGQVLPAQLDVRDLAAATALVGRAKEQFGRLDILVNNAGITRDRSLLGMSPEDWSAVIDTDLTGVFNMTRACIITFLKQRSGNVVNISSVGGIRPMAGQVNYAAAKAGVIGFTKSLAKEVAPYGVRVNAVAPGFIETDMTAALGGKARERAMQMIPLGRFGTAAEVAASVLFLLGDASQYITGQVIQTDGGLGM